MPVPPYGRGLTRRGVLRGATAVAFVGISAAALKLPFFAVDGAQVDVGVVRRHGHLGHRQEADHLQLAGLHRPAAQERPRPSSVFERPTGITVDYTADVNDNAEFYAKVKNQLGACQPIKRDMIVLTDWMAARMIDLGLDPEARRQRRSPTSPPTSSSRCATGRGTRTSSYHVPWQSGLTGIAYNADETGEVKSFEELLTRADLKGRITLLTEMRDTMGFMLKVDRRRPERLHRRRVAQRASTSCSQVVERRPGPRVHRQRVHPGPRGREHRGLRGVVR